MTTPMQLRLRAEITTIIEGARRQGYTDYQLTAEDCAAIGEALGAQSRVRSLSQLECGAAVDCLCAECMAGRPDACTTLDR